MSDKIYFEISNTPSKKVRKNISKKDVSIQEFLNDKKDHLHKGKKIKDGKKIYEIWNQEVYLFKKLYTQVTVISEKDFEKNTYLYMHIDHEGKKTYKKFILKDDNVKYLLYINMETIFVMGKKYIYNIMHNIRISLTEKIPWFLKSSDIYAVFMMMNCGGKSMKPKTF